ncbi:hypothetical protein Tco_0477876 [Tanacetum coccineum]
MDDTVNTAAEDVVRDDDQPQDALESKTYKTLKHNCQKILSVVNVKVQKLHGYGHLEEIVVRRADRQLYKFKEGNSLISVLNDIEEQLLLVVQHQVIPTQRGDIVDHIVALQCFTRSPLSS